MFLMKFWAQHPHVTDICMWHNLKLKWQGVPVVKTIETRCGSTTAVFFYFFLFHCVSDFIMIFLNCEVHYIVWSLNRVSGVLEWVDFRKKNLICLTSKSKTAQRIVTCIAIYTFVYQMFNSWENTITSTYYVQSDGSWGVESITCHPP